MQGVAGTNWTVDYIVGDSGLLFSSTDNGATWTYTSTAGTAAGGANLNGLYAYDQTMAIAVGDGGSIVQVCFLRSSSETSLLAERNRAAPSPCSLHHAYTPPHPNPANTTTSTPRTLTPEGSRANQHAMGSRRQQQISLKGFRSPSFSRAHRPPPALQSCASPPPCAGWSDPPLPR